MMSTRQRRVTILGAALVFAVAVGVGVERAARVRRGGREIEALQRQREKMLGQWAERERETHKLLAQGKAIVPANIESPAEKAPAVAPASLGTSAGFDFGMFLRLQPEMAALYRDAAKADHRLTYSALVRMLQLPEENAERFYDEMTRSELRALEISSLARAEGWREDGARLPALLPAEREEHPRTLREILGNGGYRRFEEFSRLLPVRGFVDDLVQRLYFTEQALSAAQAEAVTQLFGKYAAANAEGKLNRNRIDGDNVLAEAPGVLASKQIAVLSAQREMNPLTAKMVTMEREFQRKETAEAK